MDEITLQLVQRAVAGERRAMEQIMRALERPFFNLAQRMLLSPAEAEDAAQECLLRGATRLAQFEGGSRFSTWVSLPRGRGPDRLHPRGDHGARRPGGRGDPGDTAGDVPQATVEGARAAARGPVGELRRGQPGSAVPVPPPPHPRARATPGVASTDTPLDVAALREKLSLIGEAMRVAAYYRADPTSKPRRDLVRAALQPFTSTWSN